MSTLAFTALALLAVGEVSQEAETGLHFTSDRAKIIFGTYPNGCTLFLHDRQIHSDCPIEASSGLALPAFETGLQAAAGGDVLIYLSAIRSQGDGGQLSAYQSIQNKRLLTKG